MRARANDERPMTGKDWAALLVVCAVVIFILHELGPALDRELGYEDAKIEAHKVSLVSQ